MKTVFFTYYREYYLRVTKEIHYFEDKILEIIKTDDMNEYNFITSKPGIGFIIAASFLSHFDSIDCFTKAGQLSAYLKLVPSE